MMTQRTRIETIDVRQYGKRRTGAAYWIHSPQAALVDSGTAHSAQALLRQIEGTRLAYVFVTHVHLDHAGGAGILAAAHPEATIVCHPRAVRHLADPTRLIKAVRQASPHLFALYGTPVPIPKDRIRPAEDGDIFTLGDGSTLRAVHSAGHAPHHVCFFETSHRLLFAGDALGSHDVPITCPFTVPPGYDLEAGAATLRALGELRPERIAFTHFGIAENAPTRIAKYAEVILQWLESIDRLRRNEPSAENVVAHVLSEPEFRRLDPIDRDQVALCVRGALMTLASG